MSRFNTGRRGEGSYFGEVGDDLDSARGIAHAVIYSVIAAELLLILWMIIA